MLPLCSQTKMGSRPRDKWTGPCDWSTRASSESCRLSRISVSSQMILLRRLDWVTTVRDSDADVVYPSHQLTLVKAVKSNYFIGLITRCQSRSKFRGLARTIPTLIQDPVSRHTTFQYVNTQKSGVTNTYFEKNIEQCSNMVLILRVFQIWFRFRIYTSMLTLIFLPINLLGMLT